MNKWQTTRNTYEAAALCALDIEPKPVTMRDLKSGVEYTDWNLQTASTEDPSRNTLPFVTGELRMSFNSGELAKKTPLHPYLIALRAMHNRGRLLDAQRGTAMRLVEEAPGSFVLEKGSERTAVTGPHIVTANQDLAISLIGIGCAIIGIEHNGNQHIYKVARYAKKPASMPDMPVIDGGVLMQELKADAFYPARRWEHFPLQMHALHCLREMRKHQQCNRYIAVKHKTYNVKGAAFKENATDHAKAHVQKTLGIKI